MLILGFNNVTKKAGTKLCQARAQLGLPIDTDLLLTIQFTVEKGYNCYQFFFMLFPAISTIQSFQKYKNCVGSTKIDLLMSESKFSLIKSQKFT